MSDVFKYVSGDTGPKIKLTLTEEDTGSPVDLTGATVTLHFRAAGETTVLLSKSLVIDPATAADGIALLQWDVGDLNVGAGLYEGEVEVVLASGLRETLYDKLRFRIREDFA